MSEKTVLLGMNNPLSRNPRHALAPYPRGSSGHRLYALLHARTGALRRQYMDAFDRRNLINQRTWSLAEARWAAADCLHSLQGREVVVLGREPVEALGMPTLLVHPFRFEGVLWRQLPHPSGHNHWYHDPGNRAVVELLLEELYVRSTT